MMEVIIIVNSLSKRLGAEKIVSVPHSIYPSHSGSSVITNILPLVVAFCVQGLLL